MSVYLKLFVKQFAVFVTLVTFSEFQCPWLFCFQIQYYHLLKGKLFWASIVLISNWADSRLEDIWQENKFCLRMWTTFQVDTAMTAVSAGPGKSASQIFFYDWSDNYRRVIKVDYPGDYHESQGTRRAREQAALAML